MTFLRLSTTARLSQTRAWLVGAAACSLLACNPEGQGPNLDPPSAGSGGTGGGFLSDEDLDDLTPQGPQECVTATAAAGLVKDPVDIILIVDNSESMIQELDAVERNINENFAQILEDNEIDYRVILISQHRNRDRSPNDQIPNTGICIEAPLSGVEACPSPAPAPSPRFYHYNHEVLSKDSLQLILDTYRIDPEDPPPIELNPSNPSEGWSFWLRPGVAKVFLEMTDDDANMDSATFLSLLSETAPELFNGSYQQPRFVFHSIVGLRQKADATQPYSANEPVQNATCSGTIDQPGAVYQELSRASGGLRFPLCEFDSYDAVFATIADDVARQAPVACSFDVPPAPPGRAVTLDNVAVSYRRGSDGSVREFAQARELASCVDNAFYLNDDGRITLCPEACFRVQSDPDASVDVLFTCRSTLIQ